MPSLKPVFVHISKNAGTSIRRTAGSAIKVAGHRTAASWVSQHGRSDPLFAVVRNPFDRVVSEYFYRHSRYLAGEKNPHLANLDKSFDEWVMSTYRDGEYRTLSFFKEHGVPYNAVNMIDDCLIWFLPQTLWLTGENGELLVDETLRYETLDDDWESFARKHGINEQLVRHNYSSRKRDYNTYYSKESRVVVREYFKSDFDAFDYATD
ncbi:MAG: hypothetical protein DHS20C01_22130 [marine bacterium B5-7]|nr:MAG: hypothetical protein DHS20C01_22130 [marine bacterium B5-7]